MSLVASPSPSFPRSRPSIISISISTVQLHTKNRSKKQPAQGNGIIAAQEQDTLAMLPPYYGKEGRTRAKKTNTQGKNV
jgi:hypothetical protein